MQGLQNVKFLFFGGEFEYFMLKRLLNMLHNMILILVQVPVRMSPVTKTQTISPFGDFTLKICIALVRSSELAHLPSCRQSLSRQTIIRTRDDVLARHRACWEKVRKTNF